MKVLMLVVVVMLGSSCATLRTSTGSLNVPLLISDFQFSVAEACSVEYLPPDVCLFGTDTLIAAQAVAAKNVVGAAAAVRKVLVDAEAKLAPDSRLRPYLDGLIVLLPVTA